MDFSYMTIGSLATLPNLYLIPVAITFTMTIFVCVPCMTFLSFLLHALIDCSDFPHGRFITYMYTTIFYIHVVLSHWHTQAMGSEEISLEQAEIHIHVDLIW